MNQDILAYFITWTCYGTYLPGDERGWTKWRKGDQLAQPRLQEWCRDRMLEPPIVLEPTQRDIVNDAVRDHCLHRGWLLHAVACRTNHCHVVVTAHDYDGEQVRDQLKAWATRRLKDHDAKIAGDRADVRKHWWTQKGSVRQLFDEASVGAAVSYTLEYQDLGGSTVNR
jgi:REP element-mobilizing transposase RayT